MHVPLVDVSTSVPDPKQAAVLALLQLNPVALELGELFAAAGHSIALVGGSVRDALLGRLGDDLDFTTDARPEQIIRIVRPWAEALWDVGIAFGTVGAQKDGLKLEITTYRSEAYDRESRKPVVDFGDTLEGDLVRRDFTVNAMAVRLPEVQFVDPFQGFEDLARKVLRTPGTPQESFGDDPLRMLRAARFASQLQFAVAPEVEAAMRSMAGRLSIVSAERIQAEFSKLLLGEDPRRGLGLLVGTGLSDQFLPELPKLRLEIDEHHRHKDVYEHTLIVVEQAMELEGRLSAENAQLSPAEPDLRKPDLVLRMAALLHDIGKPRTRKFEPGGGVSFHHHELVGAKMTRKRLRELKYSKEFVDDVSQLVELHLRFHGYGEGEWTDSAVRRYVRDAGPLLDRLHKLTRSDCTTRNRRRAAALAAAYDDLEVRIARLQEQEELDSIRPDLDGNQVMELLGVRPGPVVGRAYKFLLERRLDEGPLGYERAVSELREWWSLQPESADPAPDPAPADS